VRDLTVRREPDATHWVVHERPALVNQYIREFLAR
jgi:pimeloyl-ACP methyl ester carboxylesterase